MINDVFDEIVDFAKTDDYMMSNVIYVYDIITQLKFDYKKISDLWFMINEEIMFQSLERQIDVYQRLSHFNNHLYLCLLILSTNNLHKKY